jgi:hypothetical protein
VVLGYGLWSFWVVMIVWRNEGEGVIWGWGVCGFVGTVARQLLLGDVVAYVLNPGISGGMGSRTRCRDEAQPVRQRRVVDESVGDHLGSDFWYVWTELRRKMRVRSDISKGESRVGNSPAYGAGKPTSAELVPVGRSRSQFTWTIQCDCTFLSLSLFLCSL